MMSLINKIKTAEEELEDLKTKMQALRQSNTKEVQRLQRLFDEQGIIRYADLVKSPIEQWFDLQEGVRSKRIMTPSTSQLIFICEFERGKTLNWHQHDCFEMVTILDGDLQYVENGVINTSLLLQPFETHSLFSEQGCKLIVQFWEA